MTGQWRSIAGAIVAAAAALMPGVPAASTITYYHNDLAGSPLAATNASGQVVWRESYRPYGERLTKSAASKGNDVWFTSRRQDPETGLVYMGARYYDPVAGRFISLDPKGFDEKSVLSFNRYAYANDNPYKFIDPNGKWPIFATENDGRDINARIQNESTSSVFAGAREALAKLGDWYANASILALGSVEGYGGAMATRALSRAELSGSGALIGADANKLNHIFGKVEHNLGPLVERYGSPEAAYAAVQRATQFEITSRNVSGVFETTVAVGGQKVVVRGNAIDGAARIGTFYVP